MNAYNLFLEVPSSADLLLGDRRSGGTVDLDLHKLLQSAHLTTRTPFHYKVVSAVFTLVRLLLDAAYHE